MSIDSKRSPGTESKLVGAGVDRRTFLGLCTGVVAAALVGCAPNRAPKTRDPSVSPGEVMSKAEFSQKSRELINDITENAILPRVGVASAQEYIKSAGKMQGIDGEQQLALPHERGDDGRFVETRLRVNRDYQGGEGLVYAWIDVSPRNYRQDDNASTDYLSVHWQFDSQSQIYKDFASGKLDWKALLDALRAEEAHMLDVTVMNSRDGSDWTKSLVKTNNGETDIEIYQPGKEKAEMSREGRTIITEGNAAVVKDRILRSLGQTF